MNNRIAAVFTLCLGLVSSWLIAQKAGKLLAQPFALALGAGGFLFAQHHGFKLVPALLADVFKNWHIKALS